jgi:actin-related protein 8
LKIGRASDVTPVTIANVIARKQKVPLSKHTFIEGISRPRKDRERGHVSTVVQAGDEYSVGLASDDPVSTKSIRCHLWHL